MKNRYRSTSRDQWRSNEDYRDRYNDDSNYDRRYGSKYSDSNNRQSSNFEDPMSDRFGNSGGGSNTSGYSNEGRYNDTNDNYNRRNYGSSYNSDYGSSSRGSRYNDGYDWNPRRQSDSDNRGDDQRDWWDRTKDEVSSWFGDDDAKRRRRMDDWRDDHRGKGPKNYKRSAERIQEDVNDKLSDNWMLDASNIEVSVDGNEVTLNGTVESRQAKRRAEDIADNVSGVTHVQNNLRVNENKDSLTNTDEKNTEYTSKPRSQVLNHN